MKSPNDYPQIRFVTGDDLQAALTKAQRSGESLSLTAKRLLCERLGIALRDGRTKN